MAEMLVRVQIKDDKNHYVYRVDRSKTPLGRGATAVVYEGNYVGELIEEKVSGKPIQKTLECPLGYTVAVKVAHKNTPLHLLREFNAEKEILEELEYTNSVPKAVEGIALTNEYEPDDSWKDHIIVQEYISDKGELRRFTDERTNSKAAKQYIKLLIAMHEKSIVSMGDRKATDLRWMEDDGRLVVLDWNRAKKVVEKELPSRARQDIGVFGRLWAEQLLGYDVSNLPEIDVIDSGKDRKWAELPRAWRVILKQSFDSRTTDWGYRDAKQIKLDLDVYENDREKSGTYLIEEAREELRLVENKDGRKITKDIAFDKRAVANRILTLLNWAELKGNDAATSDINILKDWANSYLNISLRMVDENIELIKRTLKRGYYDDALNIYENIPVSGADGDTRLLRSIVGIRNDVNNAAIILRAYRWGIVAGIGNDGLTNLGISMGTPVADLMNCVEHLEKGEWKGANDSYNAFKEWLNNSEENNIYDKQVIVDAIETRSKPLKLEIDLRMELLAQQPEKRALSNE